MLVTDFSRYRIGTVVKRSDHYHKERCSKPRDPSRRQLGIMVDSLMYQTGNRMIHWPVIHWENDPVAQTCHPANVVPYRKVVLQTIEIDENGPTTDRLRDAMKETEIAKLKAVQVQYMLGASDLTLLAFGYTFDRNTLYVYFDGGKLVRLETKYGHPEPQFVDWRASEFFDPSYLKDNVKRWYVGLDQNLNIAGKHLNVPLRNLFETFGSSLPTTPEGSYPDIPTHLIPAI